MKSFLSNIAIRKAVGLYLGEHEITVCKIASTPLGPKLLGTVTEPYSHENLAETIEHILTPMIGLARRIPVAVGLTGARVFFSTRLTPSGSESRAESELQKALSSSNISVEDLVADMLRGTVNKLPVAHLASCRIKYISNIIAVLQGIGVRPVRTEPSACALVRFAEHLHRPPKRSKTILHIFLGEGQGLAIIVTGGMPISWKTFVLTSGMESFAIVSAMRVLQTQQIHYGLESPLDYAIIQGRPELHEDLQREQLPSEMGVRVLWHEDPAFDGASIAYGLAIGCLSQDIKAFDLSRNLKTSPPIKEIFPWKEMAFASTLVTCMGIIMGVHSMKLNEEVAQAKGENSQHTCLDSTTPANLEKEKKAMESKIDAIKKFAGSQTRWTTFTKDISDRIPEIAELNSFYGKNDLLSGKSKSTGIFQLKGKAPLKSNGTIPQSIDSFLNELPKDPTWNRDFTNIITDIKLPPAGSKDPLLTFSISAKCKMPDQSDKKGKKK